MRLKTNSLPCIQTPLLFFYGSRQLLDMDSGKTGGIGRFAGFTITEINIQFLESSSIEKNRIEQETKRKENKNHFQDTRS